MNHRSIFITVVMVYCADFSSLCHLCWRGGWSNPIRTLLRFNTQIDEWWWRWHFFVDYEPVWKLLRRWSKTCVCVTIICLFLYVYWWNLFYLLKQMGYYLITVHVNLKNHDIVCMILPNNLEHLSSLILIYFVLHVYCCTVYCAQIIMLLFSFFMVGKATQTPICVQMVEQWGMTFIKVIYNITSEIMIGY